MNAKDLSNDAIPLFLSFCIEQYKHANQLSGKESMQILESCGALRYLEENYDVIHTQSPQWIVDDIINFVENHPAK
jgi:hypothetical protein